MALIVFRSRAAAEIVMLADAAYRLLDAAGKPATERGIITVDQIDSALQGLMRAVEQEKAAGRGAAAADDPLDKVRVSLRQRAFPLIQMLRAAQKRGVDVTWGV